MKILFLGASNTDCGHCFTADNLGNGFVKEIADRLYQDFPTRFCPGTVTNGGTDGFTFPRILKKWEQMYCSDTYELAVITGGINEVGVIMNTYLDDAAAEEFLSRSKEALTALLLGLLKNGTRHILVCEPFLFESPDYLMLWKPCLRRVREMILQTVADVCDTEPFVQNGYDTELYAQNGCDTELYAQNRCDTELSGIHTLSIRYIPTQETLDSGCRAYGTSAVTTDGIHLSPRGHALLGELLFKEICAIIAETDKNKDRCIYDT